MTVKIDTCPPYWPIISLSQERDKDLTGFCHNQEKKMSNTEIS